MQNYIIPIGFAFLTFPFIAFLITIPYMIFIYRKYGSISPLRTLIVYSFILYLISAYYLVILPLPEISEVAKLTTPKVQLMPFNFISDIMANSSLVLTDIHTYLPALKESYIYNVLFNILLFIPLGIYLKYYFRCDYKKTLLISFLVSLFFELTQLTGLYFIYPRPYRLFDVDDLIMNSLGGSIGYLLTPIVSLILPSREKIDNKSYIRGKKVGYLRRFIALFIDFIIINIFNVLLNVFIRQEHIMSYMVIIVLYFIVSSLVTKGYTIGKYIVKIRIVDKEGNPPKFHQYIIRYLSLYLILFIPNYCFYILSYNSNIILLILFINLGIIYTVFMISMSFRVFFSKKELFYEKLSNTKHISTIEIEDI